jgi:acetyl esterase/lipase
VATADAKPVGRATMDWFLEHYLIWPDDARDPRDDLVHAHGLGGLGPTTLVLAEIDPLRFDGEELGRRLRAAGVPVEVVLFEGVIQDFFGTAPIVAKAVAAQTLVGERLRASLAKRS